MEDRLLTLVMPIMAGWLQKVLHAGLVFSALASLNEGSNFQWRFDCRNYVVSRHAGVILQRAKGPIQGAGGVSQFLLQILIIISYYDCFHSFCEAFPTYSCNTCLVLHVLCVIIFLIHVLNLLLTTFFI